MLEHRFAWVLVGITFLLLLVGGFVHNTGSSLACPDWPLCYGSVLPEMKGKVAIEHSHRLLAATVGLMTIILALLLAKRRKGDRGLPNLGWLAVFLVVFQGILGGVTVIYKLPTLVSTAHLGISMIFFSVLVVIAWRTSLTPVPSPAGWRGAKAFVLAAALIVYLQSLLGALVRHTGSGIVCPDIPFCHGAPWPVSGDPMQELHMAHRWGGVLTAMVVFWVSFSLWKKGGGSRVIRGLAIAAPFLVLGQIALGLFSIVTVLGVPAVTAHLGGAILLLGCLVSLWVRIA